MGSFFQKSYKALVDSPNGSAVWWHSLPLPDGNRVNGNNPDKDLQLKMWGAMQIPGELGLAGKSASLSGPWNAYTQENPYRQFFKLTKRD